MWLLIAGWTVLMIVFLVLAMTVPMGKTSKTFTLVMSVLGLLGGGVVAAYLAYDRLYGSCVPLFTHRLHSSNSLETLNNLGDVVDSSDCTPGQKATLMSQVQEKKMLLRTQDA